MRLVKTIGLTLLLAVGMQLCAAAEKQEAFYTGEKIKGYDKGSFVVLEEDDINFRSAALGQKFDEQKAEERLGAVKQEKIDKKRKQINYTFEGAVISVARKKQAVEAIRVVDPKYITMRGVSIGDSAGRAVGQYGLPDAVVYAADNTTYEYFLQDDKEQPLRFALEVDKQSRVTAFILEKLKEK